MAKQTERSTSGNRPQYVARARQSPDSDYFLTIGVAWDAKDGMISVKLNCIPVGWNGDFLLMTPREDNGG